MQMYLKFAVALLVMIAVLAIYFAVTNKKTSPAGATYASKLAACDALQNNSVQKITNTSRVFIHLPKDIYPDKEHNLTFTNVSGSTTAGWISNGGPYGEAMDAKPGCWSYYYEFDGVGEIDLHVKSAVSSEPDYSMKFIVSKNPVDK